MENELLLARIDERQKALDEKFESHQDVLKEKLDAILAQTTKTNGRVTTLEALKNKLIGGFALFGFIVTVAEIFIHSK